MMKPAMKKLAPVARKKVRIAGDGLVQTGSLNPDQPIPCVLRPGTDGVNLVSWAEKNRSFIDEKLTAHGALLFRGFGVPNMDVFQEVIQAVSGSEMLEYTYRSTPRTQVQGRVYTSTEYPADKWIPQHNENAYSRSWPMKLFFYCEKAAEEGGMTPITDSHLVYERVPAEIRQRFAEKGVMYVRNYRTGIDLPWSNVFQTEDRSEVEEFCRQAGIEYEWNGDDLRTRQICQGVAKHPKTGKMLWFNQAHLFHVSSLEPEVREALLELTSEAGLPRNTYYGDGTPIDVADLDVIRGIYDDLLILFPWEEGDVLLLDNMAVAHGRTPFQGARKIRVGMTEPFGADKLTA